MAPPLSDHGGNSTTQSIYRFPASTSTKPTEPTIPSKSGLKSTENDMAITKPPPAQNAPHYVCSPIPSEVARYFLHRRLLRPTLLVPTSLLVVPPVVVSCLSTLAYLVSPGTLSLAEITILSFIVLALTFCMVHMGITLIKKHAPNEKSMKDALARSRYALPFWSCVLSLVVVRVFCSFFRTALFGSTMSRSWTGWILDLLTSNYHWSSLAVRAFITPVLGWTLLSFTVLCRYILPFVRCSCVPLRINPFDAMIGRVSRNFTSKKWFLDMIAEVLDMLASPSTEQAQGSSMGMKMNPASQFTGYDSTPQNTGGFASRRYSRPSMLTIVVQVVIHGCNGHLFGHVIVIPFLEDVGLIDSNENAMAAFIILLSCLLGSVLDLLLSVQEAELRFDIYSTSKVDHLFCKLRRMGLVILAAPCLSAALFPMWSSLGHLFIHGHDVSFMSPSLSIVMYSMLLSFVSTGVMVGIMEIQDEFTRLAICVSDINLDLLVNRSVKDTNVNNPFLAEDLYVQSVLVGDGATANKVVSSSRDGSKGPQEDEISRNEQACSSFAHWVKYSSIPGKISDDLLRMSLLQSLGGQGNKQEQSILKRLHLSSAASQPIIVYVTRSFLAFAGGLGESMTDCFRQERKVGKIVVHNKNTDSWVLPFGSLTAGEYAILGAARIIMMNCRVEKRLRTQHLSLLIPCVLQSAYKLRCGIFEYALFEANATGANLSTPDGNGLLDFITDKYPKLLPVIAACDEAAKMVMKCLRESGDEKVLLRWKGEMQSWIVNLNTET